MKYFVLLFCLSVTAFAQQGRDEDMIEVSVSGMSAGGSMYDVPRGYNMDKYGPERISPTGSGFQIEMQSDRLGHFYLKAIRVKRKDNGESLETQTTAQYDTPRLQITDEFLTEGLSLYLSGSAMYYSQADHAVYFGLDDQSQSYFVTNSKILEVAPMGGIQYGRDAVFGRDFQASISAALGLAPIGYAQAQVNGGRFDSAVFGGDFAVTGVVRYRERLYLKVRFSQNYHQAYAGPTLVTSNRVGHYEIGYDLTERLSVNGYAENTELILVNRSRHAIDVLNLVGFGMSYRFSQ